jgi:hypothetical protein
VFRSQSKISHFKKTRRPSHSLYPLYRMSKEYRDSLVKQITHMAEGSRVKIRGIRQDARNAVKKMKTSTSQGDTRAIENEVKRHHLVQMRDGKSGLVCTSS